MVVEIDMERSGERQRLVAPSLRDRRIDEYDGLTKRFSIRTSRITIDHR